MSVAGTITKLNKAKQIKNDEFYTNMKILKNLYHNIQNILKIKLYIVIVMTLVSVTSINFLRLTLQS